MRHQIPVLNKALRVLEAITGGAQNLSVADLARLLKLSPSTCYRILQTLIAADWVRPKSAGVGYELSLGLLPLVQPFLGHQAVIEALTPAMNRLVDRTGLSAKLTARQGSEAVTLLRVDAFEPMTVTGRVGVRFHLALGSSGSCLLAQIDDEQVERLLAGAPREVWKWQSRRDVAARVRQCRSVGYCVDRGQYHPAIHTLSVPWHEPRTDASYAVTLMEFARPGRRATIQRHRAELLRTVQDVQRSVTRDGQNNPARKAS
ncbi:MAG: helix-turn-helix domain-containing protein [Phycisphaera sp.]|nr:helix-turn-helix domain-containing protein [Phycisphaera sp.]